MGSDPITKMLIAVITVHLLEKGRFIMTFTEILCERSLYDLLILAKNRQSQLQLPDILSEEQWQILFDYAERNDPERIGYYLELAEDKDDPVWVENREDYEDEETYLAVKQFRDQEFQLMLSLEKADQSKGLLAEALADLLLKKDVFQELLSTADDGVICLLKKLSGLAHERKREDGFYAPMPEMDNSSADTLQKWGYAVVFFEDADRSMDSRRHVTGMHISHEVLDLFDEIYSREFDIRRRINNIISDVCYTARSYYEVAPLDIVMKLYRNMVMSQPDLPASVLELGEQQFIDIAGKVSKDLYMVYEYKGKYYIFERFILDNLEEEETEDESILAGDLYMMEEAGYDFYIPPAEEIRDFVNYGCWPDRDAYHKLKIWLTEYYMQNRELENMFPRMLALMSEDDSDNGYRERFTLDDVDESVKEKMSLTGWFFMSGSEVDDVMNEYSDIVVWLSDAAKEELMQLLENCRQQTNRTYMLGYMP